MAGSYWALFVKPALVLARVSVPSGLPLLSSAGGDIVVAPVLERVRIPGDDEAATGHAGDGRLVLVATLCCC